MNETNYFDIYSALIRRYSSVKVRIAEQEAQQEIEGIMNENLDRIKHGWLPRKDAHWIWWIIADVIVLIAIVKMWIKRRK